MKKILFTLLVLLSFSAANANYRPNGPVYDFMENGIAYDITDSTAKTVEVTYDVTPSFPSGIASSTAKQSKALKISYADSTSITIPSKVTHAGVTYDVTKIGDYAFYGAGVITHTITLTLPSSVKTVGEHSFGRSYFTSLSMLANGVETIGNYAFDGCQLSSNVVIPDCVKTINALAFQNCPNIETVTINPNLKNLGMDVFNYCTKLKEFKVNNNPLFTTINGVLYNADKTKLVYYPNIYGTTYTIPDGVTSIGASAFFTTKIKELVFPSSLLTIEDAAFNASDITSAKLNEGLKTISSYAFFNAYSLKVVDLPSTVTKIEGYAFSGASLKTINCKINVPLTGVDDNTFGPSTERAKCTLYVPKGTVDAYKAAPIWKDFNILEGPEGVDNVNAAKTVAGVKYVNAAGLQSSKPFEGINVVVTTYTDGTTSVAKQIKK